MTWSISSSVENLMAFMAVLHHPTMIIDKIRGTPQRVAVLLFRNPRGRPPDFLWTVGQFGLQANKDLQRALDDSRSQPRHQNL